MLNIFKELKQKGYLKSRKFRSGKIEYEVHENPKCKISKVQNLHCAESAPYNKDIRTNKDIRGPKGPPTNKETSTRAREGVLTDPPFLLKNDS